MQDNKFGYYNLLVQNGIDDILKKMVYLPYSKKYQIMYDLLNQYPASKVNRALYYYDTNYIQKERVNIKALPSILKGLCEQC